ncbi:MAG: hypothetical protein JSV83_02150 [Desulfobacterales bacterium]|nr:MAG: hypothetical protein JSV83_02150 [Desulfobacterales bacterium]
MAPNEDANKTAQSDFSQFEVRNQGVGLKPEEISRLFGKFVGMNHKTDASRNSGLGLFITKEIISKHGGSTRAESCPR